MASLVDNCVFTATSGGTGAFGMSAAVTGYQTPAAAGVIDTTKTYRYRAQSSDLSEWEEGSTVSSTTATSFTRVVIASSAGGTTTVNFTNPPTVAITMLARDVLQFDDTMSLTAPQQLQARTNIGAAPLASPTFTGVPAGPTAAAATNTTQLATTAFVEAARTILAAADATKLPLAGGTMTGTINSASSSGTIAAATATPTAFSVTGAGTAGDAAFMTFHRPGSYAAFLGIDTDNLWKVGGYSAGAVSYKLWHEGTFDPTTKANLASPTFTGTPAAPTAALATNTTQLATTAYVDRTTREKLTAARTYYVLTTGSDSNTGLVNTAGGAFLTIQKAIDTACALDLSIYAVTITVGAGTFTGANTLKPYLGTGPITIAGAGATTIISTTSAEAFYGSNAGVWAINSVKASTTTSGYGIFIGGTTSVSCTGLGVGACASGHFRSSAGARLRLYAYTISGNAPLHYLCEYGAGITCVSVTVTLTGTPAFSSLFASCSKTGVIDVEAVTWSGAATGTRYLVNTNGVINSVGGTLPGNAAGSSATGGQYT